ncbi:tyrosine-type recombinase/integrase [bacterium]|nr:tyrosine-type recombinase/integrase [bacterium]
MRQTTHPTCLRHTYASLLISKDLNFKYIQKQMGHSSFEVTMNTYAHLMPEVYEKSKLAIDGLI